jgi:hypothetical protein
MNRRSVAPNPMWSPFFWFIVAAAGEHSKLLPSQIRKSPSWWCVARSLEDLGNAEPAWPKAADRDLLLYSRHASASVVCRRLPVHGSSRQVISPVGTVSHMEQLFSFIDDGNTKSRNKHTSRYDTLNCLHGRRHPRGWGRAHRAHFYYSTRNGI